MNPLEAEEAEWVEEERDPCDHFDGDCVTGKHDCIDCWLMSEVNKSIQKEIASLE